MKLVPLIAANWKAILLVSVAVGLVEGGFLRSVHTHGFLHLATIAVFGVLDGAVVAFVVSRRSKQGTKSD